MKTVKILIVLAALVMLAALPAKAQLVVRTNITASISLAWDASPSPGLTGYNLYQGGASATYTNVFFVTAPVTTITLTNIVRGTTTFYAVTAVVTNGLESVYSNEVNYNSPALPIAPALHPPTGR